MACSKTAGSQSNLNWSGKSLESSSCNKWDTLVGPVCGIVALHYSAAESATTTRLLSLIMILGGIALVAWTSSWTIRDGYRFYFPHTTRKVHIGPFHLSIIPCMTGYTLYRWLGVVLDLRFGLAGVSFLYVWLARIENSGLW